MRLTLANDLVVDIGADSSDLNRGLSDIKTNLAIVADSLGEMGDKKRMIYHINDIFKIPKSNWCIY